MAFNPSSIIYLCNVPIDSTYQNQIYFASKTAQQSYFQSKVVKTFSDYLTVRTTRADGSLQSSVKVNANIDVLRSLPCNYMYYQNANHGTRYFYAFITKLIYINEGTTEIVFEADVYQTWLFDVTIKPSYVVREHSVTDKIGDNLVPEQFNFQDFVYQLAHTDTSLDKWGYLVGLTEAYHGVDITWWESVFGYGKTALFAGQEISGIFQGLFFYYFPSNQISIMNTRIDAIMEAKGDCLVFVAAIPEFNVSGANIGNGSNTGDEGFIYKTTSPAKKEIVIKDIRKNGSFEGYGPVNNKLFTSPYYKLVVTNHNGQQAEFAIEDFDNPDEIKFFLYGDISASPSVTLIPLWYKGISTNYDAGITITGFPQCSTNSDTFKLWLSKNQFSVAAESAASIGQIIAGIAGIVAAPASGGASLAISGGMIASGAKGVASTMNSVYQASKEPNKAEGGGAKSNLLTAIGKNKYEYFKQTIRREHAMSIDHYFTMYGYQTNKVKQPNVSSRPYFNYVQTVDINIVGGIPADDMAKLKSIYNNGVTLWKANATVGDYSVDNRPQ